MSRADSIRQTALMAPWVSEAVTASDQTIVIGPALACTRAACPTMAFETIYERLLSGESQPTVSGAVLTLSSPRGTLIFNR